MAMPTSNNNVTVRKLVSVISSLWDKVKNAFLLKTSRGAANGVASLDANGKVPSSQLPTVGTATQANYLTGFTARSGSINWGTLTTSNGYKCVTDLQYAESNRDSGDIAFGYKAGSGTAYELSCQIDGYFYQGTGQNRVLDTSSRGAANGVASLDANGKVPTSQLPTVPTGNLPANSSSSAGIVASGSGQANKVWMTDSSGNPSWRLGSTQYLYDYKLGSGGLGPKYIHIGILTPRGAGGETDQLLFSGIGGIGGLQKLVLVQITFRGSSPSISSTVLDGSTTNQTLFGWYKDSNNVYHLMMKLANWSSESEFLRVLSKGNAITFDLYNLDSEPANVTYVDNYYVTRSPMGQSVGDTTTPVYVDSDGNIKKCTEVAAKTAIYPVGFASRRTSLDWGTLTSGNGYTTATVWVTDGAEIGFAKKSGALSVQIDGVFYQREGVRRVLDTSDLGSSIPVIEHVTVIPPNPTVGTIYAL